MPSDTDHAYEIYMAYSQVIELHNVAFVPLTKEEFALLSPLEQKKRVSEARDIARSPV